MSFLSANHRRVPNKALLLLRSIAVGLLLVHTATNVELFAQLPSPPLTRILFVLDASSSMNELWGNHTRLAEAKKVISHFADSLTNQPNIHLGLRVYGHQYASHENNCTDTKLEVPLAARNGASIKAALNRIRPLGITPIGYALQQAANDFPALPAGRNIIILLTDGLESCEADPCAVSLELQRKGIILRPFVIGLGIGERAEAALSCIGVYFEASTPQALRAVMHTVTERILASGGLQVNLLDASGKPTETDVPLSLTDLNSEKIKYFYYHTLTNRGVPDTLPVDVIPQYALTVHTKPPLYRSPLQLEAPFPDTVNIPAAQGLLRVELAGKTVNQNLNNKIKALLWARKDSVLIDVLSLGETQRYLCGSYRLEVLTLPRLQYDSLVITPATTTVVTVPAPGILSLSKSYLVTGSLFYLQGSQWIKLYSLNENLNSELIGLQAGSYALVYRPKASRRSRDSKVVPFTIKSGATTSLRL